VDIAIETEALVKHYRGVRALDGVDLVVPTGSVLGLLGPNGAGKTTTVRVLSTLLEPDGGRASVAGFDVVRQAREVRSRIGLAGQSAAVDTLLSGRANLVLLGRLSRLGRAGARRRANELLERFDLTAVADRPAGTYSGGTRRRLDIACSLVASPPVLFLDEPTTGLDPASRLALWDTVRDLVSGGVTVLLTTQYLEEADQLADRIVVLADGRVIADGTADELKRKTGGEWLEIGAASPAELATVAQALAALGPQVENERVSLRLRPGTDDLAVAARIVCDAGITPTEFAMRRPTLDDVFLDLVGKSGSL